MTELCLALASGTRLVLVELQGDIAITPADAPGHIPIGELHVDDATNKATMQIGFHLLEGTVTSLPHPFVVLRKRVEGGGYDGVQVIREKVLFKSRPLPIVTPTTHDASIKTAVVSSTQLDQFVVRTKRKGSKR